VEASSSDAVLTGSNHYVVLGRVTGSTLIGCDKDFEVAVDLGIKTILDARNFFYERHSNIKSRVDDFLVQKTNPKDEKLRRARHRQAARSRVRQEREGARADCLEIGRAAYFYAGEFSKAGWMPKRLAAAGDS
jgi:hypothetical protein